MTVGLVLVIIVVILLLWFILANIRVVPQGQAYVIENLGKFKTVGSFPEGTGPGFSASACDHER